MEDTFKKNLWDSPRESEQIVQTTARRSGSNEGMQLGSTFSDGQYCAASLANHTPPTSTRRSVCTFTKDTLPRQDYSSLRLPDHCYIARATSEPLSESTIFATTSPAYTRRDHHAADQDIYQEHGTILNSNRKRHVSEASSIQGGNTRRRAWDLFKHNRSTKSDSVPNYEPPKDAIMGRGNVKRVNQKAAPINTINASRPSFTSLPSVSSPFGEPAPKRQRRASSTHATLTSSHFFNNSPERLALISSSSENVGEAASVSSQSKTAVAGIPEYKKLLERVDRRPDARIRRSRQRGISRTTQGSSPANFGAVSSAAPKAAASPTSSDVLASREIEPARVTSDIRKLSVSKRKLPQTYEGPRTKRQKMAPHAEPIEDPDEDELSAPVRATSSRIVSVGQLSPQRKAIRSTPLASQKKTRGAGRHLLSITKAGSGNFYFDASKVPAKIALQLEEGRSTFSVLESSENSFGSCDSLQKWLSVSCEKVQQLFHASTHSRYVRVKRSMSQDSPPVLWIEFSDSTTATRFVSDFPRPFRGKVSEMESPDKLETATVRALEECAVRYASRKPDERIDSQLAITPSSDSKHVEEQERRGLRVMPYRQTRRLKETMSHDVSEVFQPVSHLETEADVETSPTAFSRKTRNSTGAKSNIPPRWTHENPQWGERWMKSLTYPATGRNRATVDKEDIERLDEGEFLNDNLVNFYLRFLQQDLEQNRPEVLGKVHILSTFFFDRLRSTKGSVNYEGVKSWTAKLDIFSYDYIVVPVNESLHWYLAIICNAENALNGISKDAGVEEMLRPDGDSSPRISSVERGVSRVSLDDNIGITKQATIELPEEVDSSPKQKRVPKRTKEQSNDPRDPRIVVLDSLNIAHRNTYKCLRDYLHQEAATRKGQELELPPSGMTAKGIPQQDNYCDCGIYILGYMEEFLKDPDGAARKLLTKQDLDWDVQAPKIRSRIRELLFKLQEEQQNRLAAEVEERRRQKLQAKKISQQKSSSTTLEALPPSPRQPLPERARNPMPVSTKSEHKPVNQVDYDVSKHSAREKPQEAQLESLGSPKFIKHLSDSSSESAFKTAPSTPLSQSHQPEHISDVVPEPRLIEPLADSASDKDNIILTIEDDEEVSEDSPQVGVKTPRYTKQRLVLKSTTPEVSLLRRQSGAQYHGIERNIDLTSN